MPELTYFDTSGRWSWRRLEELWRYRELLWMFFQRDLTIRYRQVLVGVLWVLLQPALSMLIFVGLFWVLDARPTAAARDYASTASVVFLGVWAWQMIAAALRDGTGSLVNYRHVITKVYFPRLLLPLASVLCALFDFLIGGLVLIPVVALSGDHVAWAQLIILPLLVIWLVILCSGAVAWLSSLNANYRDVGYALPFLLQILMYLSPVVYDAGRIPLAWQSWYLSNPIAAIIGWMRWSILDGPAPGALPTLCAALLTVALVASGLVWFERSESRLADRI